MSKKRWEVQTETYCDGWVNCWTDDAGGEDEKPTTFGSKSAAYAALKQAREDMKQLDDVPNMRVRPCA